MALRKVNVETYKGKNCRVKALDLVSEYGTRYFRIRKDFVMIEVCQTATNIIFFSIQTHVIT